MKKALSLSLVGAMMIGALGIYEISSAQTYPNLVCNTGSSSVNPNQSINLTATGGTGTYSWSGSGITATSTSGTNGQFNVSYATPGSYMVTVTSGTQSANCFVTVASNGGSTSTTTGSDTSGTLMCMPATQAANIGQTASFTASGGNGAYTWSSPDLSITNPTGSGFSANFASAGIKSVTVRSGNNAAVCTVNVAGGGVFTPPTPPTTPGLPNTGGGYGK
jgi:hypothetical protein